MTPTLLSPVEHALVLCALLAGFVWTATQALTYRRLEAERRKQLKWLLGGAVAFLLLIVSIILVSSIDEHHSFFMNFLSYVGQVGLIVLPVSVGVAILRYRLFEIETAVPRNGAILLAWTTTAHRSAPSAA